MKYSAIRSLASFAAAFSVSFIAPAAEKPDARTPDPVEIMKKVEAAGTPGANHKKLDALVGEWKAEVKYATTPEAPPATSNATAKATWIMNGRFVQEEFQGEMMGKAFRGMSLIGYDNQKQKYTSLWVDDMHTALFTADGTTSDDGKVITFGGKMDCPITGQKDLAYKQVLRIVSPDKHVFTMYDPLKGGDAVAMEITYTRK